MVTQNIMAESVFASLISGRHVFSALTIFRFPAAPKLGAYPRFRTMVDTQLAQPCWREDRIMHAVAIPMRNQKIDRPRAAS